MLGECKVSSDLYNIAQEQYSEGKQALGELLQISMISPFMSESGLEREEAIEMFRELSGKALERLKSEGMRNNLHD